jgi:hypothetical protein
VGLPLPPIGLQTPARRPHRSRRYAPVRVIPWPQVVLVPGGAATRPGADLAPPPAPAIVAKGSLVLDVQPATAQVFVDGFYTGVAGDFSGHRGGVFLDAGPHAIDLSEPGYEPVRFDVKISPNEAVVYRRPLTSSGDTAPAAASQPPAARSPTKIYMIPGCYVGNVPPWDADLPATCDLTQTRTFVM